MSFSDLAKSRFSVRKFDGRPVKKSCLKEIIEAGRIAPNRKQFHVVFSSKTVLQFSEYFRY